MAAENYIGLSEWRNRTELKELMGVDPARTEWCAAFVNAILEMEGSPNLYDIGSSTPLLARSFLTWGTEVLPEDIQKGDVVIFPRGNQGWQGHVGFYYGTTAEGKWVILGGNQQNAVRYDLYNPNRSIGIRRWDNLENTARPSWYPK